MQKTIVLFSLILTYFFGNSQAGTLNNAFNSNSYVLNSTVENYNAVAVQPDGKIVIAGPGLASHHTFFYTVRYNPDGTLDNSFDDDGMQSTDFNFNLFPNEVSSIPTCISIQNGRIVVAGYTHGLENSLIRDSIAIALYNSDGSVDHTFSGDGKLTMQLKQVDKVVSVATQADGKIIVAGTSIPFQGKASCFLVRFNANGTLDKTFANGGIRLYNFGFFAHKMTLQNDEKIVVAGSAGEGIESRFILARFNTDGSLDNTFSGDGIQDGYSGLFAQSLLATAVALQDNGKIIVGGYTVSATLANFAVSRYNADGSLDKTFSGDGADLLDFGGLDYLNAVAIQADQKIILGGNTSKYGPGGTLTVEFALARYNTDGTLDNSFSEDGKQVSALSTTSAIYDVAIYNNLLYAVGGNELGSLGIVASYLLGERNETVLTCPSNKAVITTEGLCSAIVSDLDPILNGGTAEVSYTLSGATTGSGFGSVSGKTFNKGATTVTYALVNDAAKTCSFTVTVEDKEAPVITNVSATPSLLWPPNHKLHDITVNYTLWDNCGATAVLSVTSNEGGSSDWEVLDANHVRLRAERSGNGNERTYSITITATDASGNTNTKSVNVLVPHDMSDKWTKGKGKGELHVTVLPNPSNYDFVLQVQSVNGKPIQIRVTNAVGKTVEVIQNTGAKGTLRLGSNYKPGTYFVEVMQGNNRTTAKLVKLK